MSAKGKNIVMVIAPGDFRDEELLHPKEALERKGANVSIASISRGTFTGKLGLKAAAALSLDEIKPEDFDAIVFVGGPGASAYFNNDKALSLARDFHSKGKITSAICIAPSILANAGLLKGKKATCFESEAQNLKAKGAKYTGNPVEKDGKIITANGPAAARAFGEEIAKML